MLKPTGSAPSFEQLVKRFESILARGDELERKLAEARAKGEALALQISALVKSAGERADPMFRKMCVRLEALHGR